MNHAIELRRHAIQCLIDDLCRRGVDMDPDCYEAVALPCRILAVAHMDLGVAAVRFLRALDDHDNLGYADPIQALRYLEENGFALLEAPVLSARFYEYAWSRVTGMTGTAGTAGTLGV